MFTPMNYLSVYNRLHGLGCQQDVNSFESIVFFLSKEKGKSGAHAMKRVAAGAHLPTPF